MFIAQQQRSGFACSPGTAVTARHLRSSCGASKNGDAAMRSRPTSPKSTTSTRAHGSSLSFATDVLFSRSRLTTWHSSVRRRAETKQGPNSTPGSTRYSIATLSPSAIETAPEGPIAISRFDLFSRGREAMTSHRDRLVRRIATTEALASPELDAVNMQVRTGLSVPFANYMMSRGEAGPPSVEGVNLQVRTGLSVPFASYMASTGASAAKPAAAPVDLPVRTGLSLA